MAERDWWTPKEIIFTREQVGWLLRFYPLLSEGDWPQRPTGYVGHGKAWRRRGHFETTVEIVAELDERMRPLGRDAAILRDVYCLGLRQQKVGFLWGISDRQVRRRVQYAMWRVSGFKRKMGGKANEQVD